ncbi:hypothetical protein J6590_065921 [Homalodisca vitripennis]|nr:hypothetical protein J6590_065921 [Homalodisca vitripennis]
MVMRKRTAIDNHDWYNQKLNAARGDVRAGGSGEGPGGGYHGPFTSANFWWSDYAD